MLHPKKSRILILKQIWKFSNLTKQKKSMYKIIYLSVKTIIMLNFRAIWKLFMANETQIHLFNKSSYKISCSEYHRIMTCNMNPLWIFQRFPYCHFPHADLLHCSLNGYCYHTYCNIHESQLWCFLLQT